MNRCHVSSPPRIVLPLVLLGAVIALAISSSLAHAQPSLVPDAPETPAPSPQVHTEHYGLWVAAVDVAGFAASLATHEEKFVVGSYLAAAPAVHLLHGNVKTALGSFGLRAGLVLGGAWVGSKVGCGSGDGEFCSLGHTFQGIAIGAGVAVLADWLLLSRKTTRVEAREPALLRAGSLRANPDFQVGHTGSMVLGLRGSF